MRLEISKKMEKLPANIKGISLRSIKADKYGAQMIIVADAYGDIKSGVENYRMLTNADITFRMRGKSIDVSVMPTDEIIPGSTPETTVRRHAPSYSALGTLIGFAKTLSFNSEDATDVVEFCTKYMPLDGCEFIEMDLDQNRLSLIIKTDSLDQEALMEKLDPFKMGLVK